MAQRRLLAVLVKDAQKTSDAEGACRDSAEETQASAHRRAWEGGAIFGRCDRQFISNRTHAQHVGLRVCFETRPAGLQMALFCASVLTCIKHAPLRCSKTAIFDSALQLSKQTLTALVD